jgi:hypothetical protein
MNNSMNHIKALGRRFVSLPPLVRMQVTKKLLELYSQDQESREIAQSNDSYPRTLRKSFLEQFWDEVEQAHGDCPHAINPFTEERRAKAVGIKTNVETDEQAGYLPWQTQQSNLLSLF